ncbi:MAG: alpha/beta fold hydrolase [Rikenellaceae bacterium]|nr:alpha/beta fold hydrolase [Rikenellaceae bacterium]
MDASIKETIVCFGDNGGLTGIITRPANETLCKDFCIILLNPGIIHKIGVNGLNVKIARKAGCSGYTCFRFDFSGLGDSVSSRFVNDPDKQKLMEVRLAMDIVQKKTGISKFILKGICFGSEIAFKYALADNRVTGLILIDGIYQDRTKIEPVLKDAYRSQTLRYYKKNKFNFDRWLKLITGKSELMRRIKMKDVFSLFTEKFRTVKSSNNISSPERPDITDSVNQWMRLLENSTKILLIFCEGGLFIDVFNLTVARPLNSLPNKNQITFNYMKNVDHTFTPIWSQHKLISTIMDWLDNVSL